MITWVKRDPLIHGIFIIFCLLLIPVLLIGFYLILYTAGAFPWIFPPQFWSLFDIQ